MKLNFFSLKNWVLVAVSVLLCSCLGFLPFEVGSRTVPLFKGGDSTGFFRHPQLIQDKNGVFFAFAEKKKVSLSDASDTDIVMKWSEDNGKTWTPEAVVVDYGDYACLRPLASFIPNQEGVERLVVFFTVQAASDSLTDFLQGTEEQFKKLAFTQSEDRGATWTEPREIVGFESYFSYFSLTGSALILDKGEKKGRILLPFYGYLKGTETVSCGFLFSDDKGTTWSLGEHTQGYQNFFATEVSDQIVASLSTLVGKDSKKQVVPKFGLNADGSGLFNTVTPFFDKDWALLTDSFITLYYKNSNQSLYCLFSAAGTPGALYLVQRDSASSKAINQTLVSAGYFGFSSFFIGEDNRMYALYEGGVRNPFEAVWFKVFDLKEGTLP